MPEISILYIKAGWYSYPRVLSARVLQILNEDYLKWVNIYENVLTNLLVNVFSKRLSKNDFLKFDRNHRSYLFLPCLDFNHINDNTYRQKWDFFAHLECSPFKHKKNETVSWHLSLNIPLIRLPSWKFTKCVSRTGCMTVTILRTV